MYRGERIKMGKLIKIETAKTPKEIIEEIKKKAKDFNFIIRNVFDMAHEFKHHDIEVVEDFEYYSIMLCNPEKAYNSIFKSPIRGAVLLPPKQVVIYKENSKTILGYAAVEKDDVTKLLPKDTKFQEGLSESCKNIIKLLESVK
jgi:uncharacterized protein (DUF302 family)